MMRKLLAALVLTLLVALPLTSSAKQVYYCAGLDITMMKRTMTVLPMTCFPCPLDGLCSNIPVCPPALCRVLGRSAAAVSTGRAGQAPQHAPAAATPSAG